MAKTLTPDSRRTDLHRVPPKELVARQENRGRFAPPSDEDVKALAQSILLDGQLQPVNIRRDGDEFVLVAGFTRHEAALKIVEGFEIEGKLFHEPEFLLDCRLLNTNEEEAFKRNVSENAMRAETTPMDDAHNQEVMRSRWGKSDAEIAAQFHCSTSVVSSYKKLLNLSRPLQMMIHEGTLPVQAGLLLLDVPEAARQEIIESAINENGKVRATAVKAKLRDAQSPNKPKSQRLSRSNKELKEFFIARAEVDAPKPVKTLLEQMVSFISGTISAEEFTESIEDLAASFKVPV